MLRDDISPNLVHFTRGVSLDPREALAMAAERFESIVRDRSIRAGIGYIRGNHRCVCFSEAPISKLAYILAGGAAGGEFKYAPYGVLVPKLSVFQAGGRPVIYGPPDEYDLLPEELRYRHVRFSMGHRFNIDYTWEREWRLQCECFPLDPACVTLVLPDRASVARFQSTLRGEWNVLVLADLGVQVDAA